MSHYCGIGGDVIHAMSERWNLCPGPALCGAQVSRHAVLSDGLYVTLRPMAWPPYAKGPRRLVRCRECWEQTNKPRPHKDWRVLR